LILDAYANTEVTRLVAEAFRSPNRRALPFHLGQAALPFERFREIARLLAARIGRA
jgi:hypothetical protein